MMAFQPDSAISDVRKSCKKIWNDGISARIGGLGMRGSFLREVLE